MVNDNTRRVIVVIAIIIASALILPKLDIPFLQAIFFEPAPGFTGENELLKQDFTSVGCIDPAVGFRAETDIVTELGYVVGDFVEYDIDGDGKLERLKRTTASIISNSEIINQDLVDKGLASFDKENPDKILIPGLGGSIKIIKGIINKNDALVISQLATYRGINRRYVLDKDLELDSSIPGQEGLIEVITNSPQGEQVSCRDGNVARMNCVTGNVIEILDDCSKGCVDVQGITRCLEVCEPGKINCNSQIELLQCTSDGSSIDLTIAEVGFTCNDVEDKFECPLNAQICRNGNVEKCTDGTQYELVKSCDFGCENGACVTGCEPFSLTCVDGVLITCNDFGTGLEQGIVDDCSGLGCTSQDGDDECNQICIPNGKSCDGNNVVRCSNDGRETILLETCELGCSDAECVTICDPSQRSCAVTPNGKSQSVQCNSAGTGIDETKTINCGDLSCENGICDTCTISQTECVGNILRTCTDGKSYSNINCEFGCDKENLKCFITEESTQCSGKDIIQTLPDGSLQTVESCEIGCTEQRGSPECYSCKPGTQTCSAFNLVSCSDGFQSTIIESCNYGCENTGCLVRLFNIDGDVFRFDGSIVEIPISIALDNGVNPGSVGITATLEDFGRNVVDTATITTSASGDAVIRFDNIGGSVDHRLVLITAFEEKIFDIKIVEGSVVEFVNPPLIAFSNKDLIISFDVVNSEGDPMDLMGVPIIAKIDGVDVSASVEKIGLGSFEAKINKEDLVPGKLVISLSPEVAGIVVEEFTHEVQVRLPSLRVELDLQTSITAGESTGFSVAVFTPQGESIDANVSASLGGTIVSVSRTSLGEYFGSITPNEGSNDLVVKANSEGYVQGTASSNINVVQGEVTVSGQKPSVVEEGLSTIEIIGIGLLIAIIAGTIIVIVRRK